MLNFLYGVLLVVIVFCVGYLLNRVFNKLNFSKKLATIFIVIFSILALVTGAYFIYFNNKNLTVDTSNYFDDSLSVISTDCNYVLAKDSLPSILRNRGIEFNKCRAINESGKKVSFDSRISYDFSASVPVGVFKEIFNKYKHEDKTETYIFKRYVSEPSVYHNNFYLINKFYDEEIDTMSSSEVVASFFPDVVKDMILGFHYNSSILSNETGNVLVLITYAKKDY